MKRFMPRQYGIDHTLQAYDHTFSLMKGYKNILFLKSLSFKQQCSYNSNQIDKKVYSYYFSLIFYFKVDTNFNKLVLRISISIFYDLLYVLIFEPRNTIGRNPINTK